MFQNFIVALPEIVLLAGACTLMIVDLFVKDEQRRVSYWLAQLILLACALSTLFVWVGTAGKLVYAFNGLFVADVMGHMLKLAAYVAVSAALVPDVEVHDHQRAGARQQDDLGQRDQEIERHVRTWAARRGAAGR